MATESIFPGSENSLQDDVLTTSASPVETGLGASNSQFVSQSSTFTPAALPVDGIDLTAIAFDASLDHVLLGESSIIFTLQNLGTVDADSFEVDIVYSDTSLLGSEDDIVVGTVAISGLAAGETLTQSTDVTLPLDILNQRAQRDDLTNQGSGYTSGSTDYLSLVIDPNNDIAEANEANNTNDTKGRGTDDITYFPWDIDDNGLVTPTDAIFAINRLGQTVDETNAAADFDGNGLITPTDAIAAINRLGYGINPIVTTPDISAALAEDTGISTLDAITNQVDIQGLVADVSNIAILQAKFDDDSDEFVDITENLLTDGRFSLTSTQLTDIFGANLPDGVQTLIIQAVDEDEAVLDEFTFTFELDTQRPGILLGPLGLFRESFSSFEIIFSEAVTDEAFLAESYSLETGDNGQTVSISSVEKLSDTRALINLDNPLPNAGYILGFENDTITDLAGNTLQSLTSFNFNVSDLFGVTEISPSNGEELVALTREAIIRFSSAVDPTTVTNDAIKVIASGQEIAGRLVVSSTEEFVTFFPDEPWNPSTEVRIEVDGSKIIGRNGQALDADNDGTPGGLITADFTTLPLTRIPGTDVFGYVYDAYNRNPDGSNIPLEGVEIRLDALPNVVAITDENGYFILEDVPAPDFYVYIDGSQVGGLPDGSQYASLGKPFHSIPGEATQLFMDGEPFDIYLPLMSGNDIVELSPTEDTPVGFGADAQAFLEEQFPDIDPAVWQRTQVTFPAGSATDDDGNAATQALIVPVDPERLPAPLPPGLELPLVISIQAGGENGFNREADGGATNFDVPAPLTFPNLDGLAPGEKALIWSFNHDAGKWEVNGTGTVSDDGQVIESDEGVGIRAPGWHGAAPGDPVNPPPPPNPDPPCPNGPNPDKVKCLKRATEDYALCAGAAIAAGLIPGAALGAAIALAACTAKYALDVSRCDEDFSNCAPSPSASSRAIAQAFLATTENSPTGDAIGDQIYNLATQIGALINQYVLVGEEVPLDVQEQIAQLGAQADELAEGDAAGYMRNLQLQEEIRTRNVEENFGNAPSYPVLYAAQIQSSNGESFVVRGETQPDGQYTLVVPRGGQINSISFFDPATNSYGVVTENLDPSATYRLPRFTLVPLDEGFTDSDSDALADVAEFVLGTSISSADTDGDGISDSAEVEQGLDPLGGQGFPTGIIANLELLGTAREVTLEGSIQTPGGQTAYIATGDYGLAVVDATDFDNPIIQGQINLDGNNVDVAIDTDLDIAAVAGTSGLHLVDVADPMMPELLQTVGISATEVEVTDGIAYVATGNNLSAIDLLSGESLQSITLEGSGFISDIARQGTTLYTYTSGSDTFSVIDISNPTDMNVLGDTNVSVASSEVGISVGNGIAYVAGSGLRTVDISDPTQPSLLGNAESFFTARDIALNGSGLGLVAAENQGLGVYSLSDPQDTDALVTQIDTTGFTYDVAIASGIAYIADGTNGLTVVNYLSFDSQGQAPTVAIDTSVDLDDTQPGIQVLEGSSVPLQIEVTDDVQVRNVELLVDGNVVGNDVSFPFDLNATALSNAPEGTSVDIQVRATDTGGNSTLSDPLTVELVPDTFAPEISSTSPSEGTRRRAISGFSVRFNEAIDENLLSIDGMSLTNLGEDGALGGGDDTAVTIPEFQLSESGRTLYITAPTEEDFVPGDYQLQLAPSIIADRSGNGLENPFMLNFTKRAISEPLSFGELIEDAIVESGEDQVFTFDGSAGQRVYFDGLDSTFGINAQLFSPSDVSVTGFISTFSDSNPITLIEDGTYRWVITGSGSTTGDYSFQIFDIDAADTLSLDTVITDTLDPGRSTMLYQFEGTEDQALFFDGLSSDSGSTFYIYGPGNQQITARDTRSDQEFNLPGDGTYVVAIEGNSNTTDPVDFSFELVTPDNTTTALTLDTITNGTISESGEVDTYTFDGTAGQQVYFDGISGDFSINARLVDPSGRNVSGFSANSTTDSSPVSLLEDGTYQLIIDGSGNAIGDYSFQLNDLSIVNTLTLDNIITDTLDPSRSTMLYQFEGTEDQALFFDGLSSDSGSTFYIYGPGNQQITARDTRSDQEFNLPGDGTYVVAIEGNSNTTDPVDFSFELVTPDNTTTALTLDTITNGTISESGEVDTYTFDGTAGQQVYFDGISGDFSINARLVDPSGRNVSGFSANSTTDSSPVSLLEDGTYQLIIDGSGNAIGDYSFQLNDLSIVNTLTLDTIITDTLDPSRSTMLYQFEGTEDQALFFDGLSSDSGSTFYIYGPGNQQITARDTRSDQEFNLPGDGTYVVAIEGNSNTTDPVDFSFELVTPDNTTTALTLDTITNGTISESGEVDTYTFDGTAGQRVYFDGISGTNISARLIDPSGNNVSGFSANSNTDSSPVSLLEDGTYQLIIDGSGSTTGDYSFQLNDLSTIDTLTLDTIITDTLDPGRSTMLYQFEGTEEQVLFFDGLSNTSNSTFYLYGPGNQQVAAVNTRFDREINLPGDGTYVVAIEGFSDNSVDFRFELAERPSDDPTPVVGTPLTLGTLTNGSIAVIDEVDTYTFNGTAGQRIYLDGISGSTSIDASLISPSGVTVFSFANANDDRGPITLLESGTYQLNLDGSGNTTGDYSFRLSDLTDATDLTLDTVVSSTLETGRETDLYSFEGTAGQALVIEGLGDQGSGAFFYLYGPNNQQVTSSSLGGTQEVTLPGTGTYILATEGFNNAPVDYSVQIVTPDNSETVLTLGETVNGSIAETGEVDTYTFNATAGQQIYFDGISGSTSIDASLISPSGVTVFSFANANDDRGPITLLESGTYQLNLDGSGNTTGDYSFRLSDLTDATDLTLDTVVSSTLETGRETDLYSFEGTAGQALVIEGLGDQGSGAFFYLYGPNNQQVTSSFLGGTQEITLPSTGTYILAAEGFNNAPVDYSVQIVTPDNSETALTLGETVNGSIAETGEVDTYTFNATAGQQIYFDGISGSTSIDASLISPSGVTVFSFANANDDRGPITLIESGTYQLNLDGSGNTTGDYSFRLSDLANATDLTLDTVVNGTLETGRETDLYSFEGTAGQELFIEGLGDQGGGFVYLYSPNNQQIAFSFLTGTQEVTLPGTGRYILSAEGANSSVVNYSFQVATPSNSEAPLTLDETVNGTISETGEIDTYTFNGTAGQRLFFDGISGSTNIDANLTSPSGVNVFSFANSNDDRGPVSLIETGLYRLTIDGASGTTGDYSFRLLDTDSASTLFIGNTVSGTLQPGLSTQIFKFSGSAGQNISIEDLGSNFGGTYRLYGPGNQVITSRNFSTAGGVVEAVLPGDGTYFLVLDGFSANVGVNYQFRVI